MQFGLRTLLFVVLLLGMLVLSYPLLFKPLKPAARQALADSRQKRERLETLAGAMKDNASMSTEIDKLRTAISFLESQAAQGNGNGPRPPGRVEGRQGQQPEHQERAERQADPGRGFQRAADPHGRGRPFYPSFFKFLTSVEQLDRLTKINDMKVDADDKSTNGSITADFTLTIYYESSQKVAVAP